MSSEELTTDQLRNQADRWTLAGDAQLRTMLQKFSENLERNAQDLQQTLTDFEFKVQATQAALGNVHNRFNLLSHSQFIESRVYEEDEEEKEPAPPQGELRVDPEEEFRQKASSALSTAIDFVTNAFQKVEFDGSDSEEDDVAGDMEPVYESKNFYFLRSLPHIIGTVEFLNEDNIGLENLNPDHVVAEDHYSEHSTDSDEEDSKQVVAQESEASAYSLSSDEDVPRPQKSPSISSRKLKKHSRSSSKRSLGSLSSSRSKNLFDSDSSDEEGLFSGKKTPPRRASSSQNVGEKKQPKVANSLLDELSGKLGIAPPAKDSSSSEEEKEEDLVQPVQPDKPGLASKLPKLPADQPDNLSSASKLPKLPPAQVVNPEKSKQLFDSDSDDGLFSSPATVSKSFTKPAIEKPEAKKQAQSQPNVKPASPTKVKASLFSTSDDEIDSMDDLFASAKTASSSQNGQKGKGLFESSDEDDDFDLLVNTKEPRKEEESKLESSLGDKKIPEDVEEKPKKKLPAGAVSIFGGFNPPNVSKDKYEEKVEDHSVYEKAVDQPSKNPGLFESSDEDDSIFSSSKIQENVKKPNNEPKTVNNISNSSDSLLKSNVLNEATLPEYSSEPPPHLDNSSKDPSKQKAAAEALPKKKLPAGAVSMFGGFTPPNVCKDKDEEKVDHSVQEKGVDQPSKNPGLFDSSDEDDSIFAASKVQEDVKKPNNEPNMVDNISNSSDSQLKSNVLNEADAPETSSEPPLPLDNSSKDPPKQKAVGEAIPKKKLPAGAVSMFGGFNPINMDNHSSKEKAFDPPPKHPGLFDKSDDEEDSIFEPSKVQENVKKSSNKTVTGQTINGSDEFSDSKEEKSNLLTENDAPEPPSEPPLPLDIQSKDQPDGNVVSSATSKPPLDFKSMLEKKLNKRPPGFKPVSKSLPPDEEDIKIPIKEEQTSKLTLDTSALKSRAKISPKRRPPSRNQRPVVAPVEEASKSPENPKKDEDCSSSSDDIFGAPPPMPASIKKTNDKTLEELFGEDDSDDDLFG